MCHPIARALCLCCHPCVAIVQDMFYGTSLNDCNKVAIYASFASNEQWKVRYYYSYSYSYDDGSLLGDSEDYWDTTLTCG